MKTTIQNLFDQLGYNISTMEINKPYDIKDKNKKILAYDFDSGINSYKEIHYIVYKGLFQIYEVNDLKGNTLLRCSGDHRIYDCLRRDFIFIKDAKMGCALLTNGSKVSYIVNDTEKEEPIVDFQIEGENYFSNDVLSHNTVLHLYTDSNNSPPEKVKSFIKNVIENSKLPYITYSPIIRYCKNGHGLLNTLDNEVCPYCKQEAIDAYKKKLSELEEKKKTGT